MDLPYSTILDMIISQKSSPKLYQKLLKIYKDKIEEAGATIREDSYFYIDNLSRDIDFIEDEMMENINVEDNISIIISVEKYVYLTLKDSISNPIINHEIVE